MITSFKRNYLTLARSCFCKGKIFRKSSSLLSIICSMRSLDAHETVLKKKMKLLEIAGNENKKTNRNSSYFLLSSWASSLKGFWISTLVPMFQGNLIAQDHSVIYIYITEWSTKVEIQNPLSEDPLRIRTPINTDTMDTFLCPEAQTLSTLLFTGTGYLRTVCFPCHNHVLFVDILHCPNNDRFLGLSSRIAWMIDFK